MTAAVQPFTRSFRSCLQILPLDYNYMFSLNTLETMRIGDNQEICILTRQRFFLFNCHGSVSFVHLPFSSLVVATLSLFVRVEAGSQLHPHYTHLFQTPCNQPSYLSRCRTPAVSSFFLSLLPVLTSCWWIFFALNFSQLGSTSVSASWLSFEAQVAIILISHFFFLH